MEGVCTCNMLQWPDSEDIGQHLESGSADLTCEGDHRRSNINKGTAQDPLSSPHHPTSAQVPQKTIQYFFSLPIKGAMAHGGHQA